MVEEKEEVVTRKHLQVKKIRHALYNNKEGPSSFEVTNDKRHVSRRNVIFSHDDNVSKKQ